MPIAKCSKHGQLFVTYNWQLQLPNAQNMAYIVLIDTCKSHIIG
jgi:hypothetical protein